MDFKEWIEFAKTLSANAIINVWLVTLLFIWVSNIPRMTRSLANLPGTVMTSVLAAADVNQALRLHGCNLGFVLVVKREFERHNNDVISYAAKLHAQDHIVSIKFKGNGSRLYYERYIKAAAGRRVDPAIKLYFDDRRAAEIFLSNSEHVSVFVSVDHGLVDRKVEATDAHATVAKHRSREESTDSM